MDGFNDVLAKDPNDLTALKQIASINRNIGNFALAKEYEKKVIAIAPNDAEAYYTIGFIDWTTEHYKNTVPILAADGSNRRRSRQCEEEQGSMREAGGG